MKERGGKPSPRGYCVHRYPFEREVSRNALNFQSAPLALVIHFAQDQGSRSKSRHFSDVRQHSSPTCPSSPKRVRPVRPHNRPAWHRCANGKPGDSATRHHSATAGGASQMPPRLSTRLLLTHPQPRSVSRVRVKTGTEVLAAAVYWLEIGHYP